MNGFLYDNGNDGRKMQQGKAAKKDVRWTKKVAGCQTNARKHSTGLIEML